MVWFPISSQKLKLRTTPRTLPVTESRGKCWKPWQTKNWRRWVMKSPFAVCLLLRSCRWLGDSISRDLDLSLGRDIVLYSWARHSTLAVAVTTQEFQRFAGWKLTCDNLASRPAAAPFLLVSCLMSGKRGHAEAVISRSVQLLSWELLKGYEVSYEEGS